jgi:hypothetical protein
MAVPSRSRRSTKVFTGFLLRIQRQTLRKFDGQPALTTIDLTTVSGRNRLKPQNEPHYVKLLQGCHAGFRKTATESVGTWSARYTNSETGKQHKMGLIEPHYPMAGRGAGRI